MPYARRNRLLPTAAILLLIAVPAIAGDREHDGNRFHASLNGYNEVLGGTNTATSTGSVSTAGAGRFKAELDRTATTITYELRYTLETAATVAHIHFAQRHVNGNVVTFLCGGGTKATTPCPAGNTGTEAVVTGVIQASDITGPATDQGLDTFEELVRAIRAGAAYVNVHSTRFPRGEIRGQIGGRDGDDD